MRKVLDEDTGLTTAWELANAIVSVAGQDVDILNLSLGCRTVDGQPPLVLRRAIERLDSTTVVVAAAGNLGDTEFKKAPIWPAALAGVTAVGSSNTTTVESMTDPSGFETIAFSPELPWVQWLAKGGDVVGAYVSGKVLLSSGIRKEFTEPYARWSGTSFAAATFSGFLAGRLEYGKAREGLLKLEDEARGTFSSDVVEPYVHRQDAGSA